jgi:3-oxoacyl-[acyl-carrier protein] reductase
MTQKLTGKVAVVTGASKGIGAAIAKSLSAEGASIVVNYASSKADAEAVVAEITRAGGKAVAVKGDVSKAAEADGIISVAMAEYGRLDILVNNAGVYEFAPLEAITGDHFHRLFNVNVLGPILMTQAAVKHLGEGGSIINIGACITTMKPPASSVYSASKSAVETITAVFAKELGKKNIRVNSVNPGPTETEGSAKMAGGNGKEKGNSLIAQTPLGRIGKPGDIAKVVVFLSTDDSGWITGDVLVASGGLA